MRVTASGYIKNIWNGSASGAGGGTLSGPDSSGFYTIVLTGVVVPDGATQVTGGVGYTYSLSSAFPLTEIDLPTRRRARASAPRPTRAASAA